jgi:hypothetical protein
MLAKQQYWKVNSKRKALSPSDSAIPPCLPDAAFSGFPFPLPQAVVGQ